MLQIKLLNIQNILANLRHLYKYYRHICEMCKLCEGNSQECATFEMWYVKIYRLLSVVLLQVDDGTTDPHLSSNIRRGARPLAYVPKPDVSPWSH